jgi:hypothetical protein
VLDRGGDDAFAHGFEDALGVAAVVALGERGPGLGRELLVVGV